MITFFHRNIRAGYSINKVTQTVISAYKDKVEFYLPFHGASLNVIIRNLIFTFKHRDLNSVNHITGDIQYAMLALIGCRSVLTIHDTVSLDFRKMNPIKKIIFEWIWYRIPLRLATKVVCISEETKKSIQRFTDRNDIIVIHNAIDPIFQRVPKDLSQKPFRILLIGTSSNKNLERTVEALNGFKCQLTIIGNLTPSQVELIRDNHIEYEVKSGLTDSQIVDEYIKADIVSFISLFEGFGMIIIEANQVGRPIICSDIPVLKEIANDSALYVNPTDVTDIRNGFKKLFEDSSLRYTLVENGFINITRFNVHEIRNKWTCLYNSIR